MSKFFLLISALFCTSCLQAGSVPLKSSMPLSVDTVEVHRVREQLIRIIVHNPAFLTQIEIERLATPELKLLEKQIINSITLNTGKKLSFTDSVTGVYSKEITIDGTSINIPFEYFPARGQGFLVNCTIEVGEVQFSTMDCSRKEMPPE